MTPEEIAIRWCNEKHALDMAMRELHARGSCCSECGSVAKLIREAEQRGRITGLEEADELATAQMNRNKAAFEVVGDIRTRIAELEQTK